MAKLKVNFSEFDGLIGSINSAINTISSDIPGVKSPSKCQDTVLTDYYDRIVRISTLLKNYKSLIEKDLQDIENSRQVLEEMDQKMIANFKK